MTTKMNVKQIENYHKKNKPFDQVVVLVHSGKGPYNNFGTCSDLSNIDFRGIKKLVVRDAESTCTNIKGVEELEVSAPTSLWKSQCPQSFVQLNNCGFRKVSTNGVAFVSIKESDNVEEVNIKAASNINIEETPKLALLKASKTDLLNNYSVVNAPHVVLSHELQKAVTRISLAKAEERRAYEEKYAAHNAALFRNSL